MNSATLKSVRQRAARDAECGRLLLQTNTRLGNATACSLLLQMDVDLVNWDAVSAIGQILSALAVVVSLIYLAAEVRQNSSVVKAATSQKLAETALQFSTALGSVPGLGDVFNRGLRDPSGLSEPEAAQFTYLFHAWVRLTENGHYQFSNGLLDEQLWYGWTETARSVLATPGGKQIWSSARPRVRNEFREFIDNTILPATNSEAANNFLDPFRSSSQISGASTAGERSPESTRAG